MKIFKNAKSQDDVDLPISATLSFFDFLPFPALIYDDQGIVVSVNKNMKKLIPKLKEGLNIGSIQNIIEKYCDKDVLKYEISQKMNYVIQEQHNFKFEGLNINKRLYECFLINFEDKYNKKVFGGMILNDITYFKEVDKMKTEFVAFASHQLRTPLSAIRWNIEMLAEEDDCLSSEQKEYVDDMYQSTKRMIKLINDILDVSRFETDKLIINKEKISLNDIIKKIKENLKPFSNAKNCEIDFLNKEDFYLYADKELLYQVLYNIVDNAVRYSAKKDKNKVIIKAKSDPKEEVYIITVEDNGIGIPKELQKRIFEKFFRAPNAVKISATGSGIGLYTSKIIIEAMGGKIWFTSKEGKGTKFYISLQIV